MADQELIKPEQESFKNFFWLWIFGATAVSLRVKPDTKRRLIQELVKINKKDFGRRIKADELIALALSLIESQHIAALQQSSLSNADRLEMQYRDYSKKHGALSKDEFLGKMLRGEVRENV